MQTRMLGRSKDNKGRYTRFVEELTVHGAPITFQELCRKAISPKTRYVVLDLDKTFHLDVNLGELLGWELIAYHSYGKERLEAGNDSRASGRLWFDWDNPLAVARYLALGARVWALPGLFYLMWGRVAYNNTLLRRWSYKRFGPEPIRTVQLVPQTVLLHQLAKLPLETLRELATRVWERNADAQAIDADDIAWLREWCPGVRIMIASASPQPMVKAAAALLGVDDALYSTIEERQGYLSAPHRIGSLLTRPQGGPPERIAPPSSLNINSSHAKITNLTNLYPNMFDPDVETVGITDTGYGEDHCWAQHFTRVVDINSPNPFPPIIASSSPLRAIHSAQVLTRSERLRKEAGDQNWRSSRRGATDPVAKTFTRDELERVLGRCAEELETLAAKHHAKATALEEPRRPLEAKLQALQHEVEATIIAYNQPNAPDQDGCLNQLRAHLQRELVLRRELTHLELPLSETAFALNSLLDDARRRLEIYPAPA